VVKFHPLLFLLGILDITAGFSYLINFYIFPLYFLTLIKGIWSLTTSVPYKDLLIISLSLVDIIFSLLAIFTIKIDLFGVLMLAKGIISLL